MATLPNPHGRRLLIEVEPVKEEEQDGIILPETRSKKPTEGVVVAVGEGGNIPLCASVGEVVIFPALGNQNIKIEDKHFVLVRDDDVLAVKEL